MSEQLKDITIIGGGSAGLYAAFYAGMRDLSVQIIEAQEKLGGKVHFYPEKLIWDVGGMTPITGADLIEQMAEQGMTFEPDVVFNQKISKVEKRAEEHFVLTSESGQQFESKAVIIATGGGLFTPKKLPLANCEPFEQTNLHYNVYRMKTFEGKRVGIIGGGNSAIDWAHALRKVAKEVHVVHRSDVFRAHESMVRQLKETDVTIHAHSSVKKLVCDGTGSRIQAMNLFNQLNQSEKQVGIDELIVNIGFNNEENFHHDPDLGLELVDNYYIKGTAKTATAVDGMYAIGDILDFDGKVRLIAGAYNDAANAVNQIKLSFDPSAKEKAQVSSHNEKFDELNEQKKELLYR